MNFRACSLLTSLFIVLVLSAPATTAQVSNIVPGAVTVLGEGSASTSADFADIAITLGPDSNLVVEPLANESSTTSAPSAVDVSDVFDAIIAQGVPVNDVTVVDPVFAGEWGSGMTAQPVMILVRVPTPTPEGLSDLLDVVRNSAHANGLFVNQFGVVYGVNDCRALRQQARINAVDHARSEAEDQAAALEKSIGEIVASRDSYPVTLAQVMPNGCNSNMDARFSGSLFDPGAPAEVTVVVAVEVSFEIL